MARLADLGAPGADPQQLAQQAQDRHALLGLLKGISPAAKKAAIRENSFKALMLLSQSCPDLLFPHWAYLLDLLKSDNAFSKYAAVHLIAALACADREGRFEKAFDRYYALLDDGSVMVAAHVAGSSGAIARIKPRLQSRITKRLLEIDKTHFDAGHRDLVKSYAIVAFGEYIAGSRERDKIIAFVRKQLDAKSPRTRKMAREFLDKWAKRG